MPFLLLDDSYKKSQVKLSTEPENGALDIFGMRPHVETPDKELNFFLSLSPQASHHNLFQWAGSVFF